MRPPTAAASVFGDRLEVAERYAEWLTGAGITRGLLGPREADQIWERHLLNGVGLASVIEPGSFVIDLGSGAGLPGVPLLLARPDLQVVLVEAKARRADFLREVCADLGLSARVVRGRATRDGIVLLPEGAPGAAIPAADVVTARAVAAIAELARWARPLLRPGGRLLAVKGSSADEELDRDRAAIAVLGFQDVRILDLGALEGRAAEPAVGSTDPAAVVAATVVSMRLGRVSRET